MHCFLVITTYYVVKVFTVSLDYTVVYSALWRGTSAMHHILTEWDLIFCCPLFAVIIFSRHRTTYGPNGLHPFALILVILTLTGCSKLLTSYIWRFGIMLFRFGVILTPESSDVEVFVLGSRAEMGHWDPSRAVQMKASQKLPSPHEPCLWVGDVQLAEPVREPLWFKFVKRLGGSFIWEGTHVSTTSYLLYVDVTHIQRRR